MSPARASTAGHRVDSAATARALAARQHGVVGRSQLLAAGVSAHWIRHRLRTGRLHPIHRGVYRVGVLPVAHEQEAAALLASGPTAVLSHRSAAHLWSILDKPTHAAAEVTIQRNTRLRRGGIRIRRSARLTVDDITMRHGLPVTSPRRTLLDLAGTIPLRELEHAVARAFRLNCTSPDDLGDYITRHTGRRGTHGLRALLGPVGGPAFTRSEAEVRFLALLRRGNLPRPAVNARVRGFEVDFAWLDARLLVEVDGFAYHSGRSAFERDRARDSALAAAGFRVVRVTWRQLTSEPAAVLVKVAQALAQP